jgi:homoserine kinase
LKAANHLLGTKLSNDALLAMASSLEGHPDNAAPALLGGFVISVKEGGNIQYLRALPAKPLQMVAGVPEYDVKTANSRKALPQEVPFADAVFNVARASLLVGALLTGRYEHLRRAMEDRLHQPYRRALAPGLEQVMAQALKAGAYGACLSGSGPAVLVFCPGKTAEIEKEIVCAWREMGISSRTYKLQVCTAGAAVTVARSRGNL